MRLLPNETSAESEFNVGVENVEFKMQRNKQMQKIAHTTRCSRAELQQSDGLIF